MPTVLLSLSDYRHYQMVLEQQYPWIMDRIAGQIDVVEMCLIEAYILTPNPFVDTTIWKCVANVIDQIYDFVSNGKSEELDLYLWSNGTFSTLLYNIVCHYLEIFRAAIPSKTSCGGCIVNHHVSYLEVGQRESSASPY